MSATTLPVSQSPTGTHHDTVRSRDGTLWLYTLTTLLSALLLFSIQPMFAKMVLPVLGGSPSVWAVALAFFQGALLAGYCYAHALMRFVPPKWTGIVHLGFCLFAFVALPIGLPEGWREPPPGDPYLWQFGLFAVAIGIPFMAVAANAPLIQAWFARAGHAQSADPYFLYAASNIGSFIALLGYPLVLEPLFGVSMLSEMWLTGFVVLIGGLALCFSVVWRKHENPTARDLPAASIGGVKASAAPDWKDRLTWIGLAMVPSAMLTAFSTHISTDVASAPLLWVVPLALYLLTFVFAFREAPLENNGENSFIEVVARLNVVAVVLLIAVLSQVWWGGWFATSWLGFAAFLLGTLVAHRTLYKTRPGAAYLTGFYLWMSFGGALGGLFAALVAPKIFSEVYEYPLILALTLACRPAVVEAIRNGTVDLKTGSAKFVAAAAGLTAFAWVCNALGLTFWEWGVATAIVVGLSLPLFYFQRQHVNQFAIALLMMGAVVLLPSAVHVGDAQRSYFGVYRVKQPLDGQYTVLMHGTTYHGAQRRHDKDGNPVNDITPGSYYYPGGPIHQAVDYVQQRLGVQSKGRFGVVGLGAGAMACHARAGETWRFYEIDPLMVEIAKSKHFSYLAECQPNADIVIGDARLTLAKEQDASFDLLVIDAFSSDAVPVHLLTREAIELYTAKLKPDGVALLHISNRYLNLEGVLQATMQGVEGVEAVVYSKMQHKKDFSKLSAQVVVFSRNPEVVRNFMATPGARTPVDAGLKPWTDDSSDILAPMLSKYGYY